jgi:hypothetical protein
MTYGNQFVAGGIPVNLLSVLARLATAKEVTSIGGEVGKGLTQEGAALGAAAGADLANALRAAGSAPTAAVGVGVSQGKLTAPPATVGLLSASHTPVQTRVGSFPACRRGIRVAVPPAADDAAGSAAQG